MTSGWRPVAGMPLRALWIRVSGTNLVVVGRHRGTVLCVAWSPDGRRLASTSKSDGAVKIWDAQANAEVQAFRGHQGGVRSVTWRPDGKQVASAGEDGTIKNLGCESCGRRPPYQESPARKGVNPDGLESGRPAVGRRRRGACGLRLGYRQRGGANRPAGDRASGPRIELESCGKTGGVWGFRRRDPGLGTSQRQGHCGAAQAGASNGVQALAWSPDGTRLAAVGGGNHLRVRDARTGAVLATFDHRGGVGLALAWSPDGKHLAVGCSYVSRVGTEIEILDATTGSLLRALRGHRDNVRSLAWTRDSRRLASASEDTTIRVWEVATGKEIHTLWGHSSRVNSVAWSPDQTRLASGSEDGTVKIWDAASGEEVCSLAESVNPDSVTAVAWTPDGTRLASGSGGGTILIRDSTPGRAAEERLRLAEIEQVEAGKEPNTRPR